MPKFDPLRRLSPKATKPPAPFPLVHFEIHAEDPERALRFYRTLFGWEFVTVVPTRAIPGVGWLAYAKDTEGNIFGVMQADAAA